MNPLTGIYPACGNVLGYRYASPDGDASPTIVHARSFTFSAKEKDSETGLSYFGSRYYSSDLSIWLSVDPMSDKYPSLSPYVYCADNPVKLVDPEGEEMWIPEVDGKGNVSYIAEDGDNYETFIEQFYCFKRGKDNKLVDKSLEIFNNAGYNKNSVLKKGDKITGAAVYNAMGNDILKGIWSKMDVKQKAYQIKFALDCGKRKNIMIGGMSAIDLNDFIYEFSTSYNAVELNNIKIPELESGKMVMVKANITIWPKNGLENKNGQILIYWGAQATGEGYNTLNYYSAINPDAQTKKSAITISLK
ncbi:MAG: RHS repeat-associated core domain-containing protein [Bacteroidales bacterium]|nr:RHS repeat-associated core domain-containing protein [Bacteroidales bacterium]